MIEALRRLLGSTADVRPAPLPRPESERPALRTGSYLVTSDGRLIRT